MSIGAFVVTRDGEHRLPAVIANLRQVAECVVVYVDVRSTDNTLDVARNMGAEVISGIPDGGIPEGAFAACVDALDTDWLLHLDDDELVGPHFIDRLPRMLSAAVAWRFPRYHVYPTPDYYITSAPYYPDHQLRLIPRAMWINNGGWEVRVHTSPAWECAFASTGIFHYKFMLFTPEQRAARMAQWVANWQDAASPHYRAFSEIAADVRTERVPEPLPEHSFFEREVFA